MDVESQQYTAFICKFKLFQYVVMPMGLTNSPATFQRYMELILKDEIEAGIVTVFMDDFLIHSNSTEQHLKDVSQVFQKLKDAGAKLKPSKCEIAQTEIKFLGHVISDNSIKQDPDKVANILTYERPRTLQQLQAFLGLANYYRKYCENFAQITQPLVELSVTKHLEPKFKKKNGQINNKKVEIKWNEKAETAFNHIKAQLCNEKILKLPDFEKEFQIYTDACEYGYGGVLSQRFEAGSHPIAYFSKGRTKAQKNYSTSEKGLMAIVKTILFFHYYLYGRHFKVYTDHKPLSWLLNKSDPSSRLARWLIILDNYDFEIIYKKGAHNGNADGTSRMPDPEVDVEENDYDDILLCAQVEQEEILDEEPTDDQHADEDVQWIIDILNNHSTKPDIKEFDNPTKNLQYVIPSQLIDPILQSIHTSYLGGHLGVKKTIKKVTERFYRPFLKKTIAEFVKRCDICQKVKANYNKSRGQLMYLKPREPNQIITMDIAGPFPETQMGNKYFIVIVDAFTKRAEIYAMKDTHAKVIADIVMNEWVSRYGVPISILTDQGTNFQSMLLEMLYEYLDIRRLRTTAFHPQCDGESERFIQTMKNMISSYINENQTNWDQNLMKLAFAYNSSVHASTKQTPFEMTFGQKPRLPCDVAFGPETNIIEYASNENEMASFFDSFDRYKKNIPQETLEYIIKIKQQMATIYEKAQLNRDVVMDRAKIDHDRNIKKRSYEIGDLVLTDHPQLAVGLSSGIAH